MVVLYLTMTLRADWCNSLKDKRSEVRKVLAKLKNGMNISACETHEQDMHRLIGISIVGLVFDHAQADALVQRVLVAVDAATDAELIHTEQEYR